MRRQRDRFPHIELDQAGNNVPSLPPTIVNQMDGASVLQALGRVEELYRAPLALFYLEEHSYKEIAEILEVPMGTVQSRIARGKAQLQKIFVESDSKPKPPREKEQRG
jgi:RNA polymerase sigma-70 factor (ECF subfamily)